jgi:GxxExxY protein
MDMSQAAGTKFATRTMTAHEISHAVISAAVKVHSALGPGLLESAYEACLAHEFRKASLKIETQVGLPVVYDGIRLDLGYRIDMLVNDLVVLELKSVEDFARTHCSSPVLYETQQETARSNHQFQRFTSQRTVSSDL